MIRNGASTATTQSLLRVGIFSSFSQRKSFTATNMPSARVTLSDNTAGPWSRMVWSWKNTP